MKVIRNPVFKKKFLLRAFTTQKPYLPVSPWKDRFVTFGTLALALIVSFIVTPYELSEEDRKIIDEHRRRPKTVFLHGPQKYIDERPFPHNHSQTLADIATVITNFETNVVPLLKEKDTAVWEAKVSKNPDDWLKVREIQHRIDDILGNPEEFQEIKRLYNELFDEFGKRYPSKDYARSRDIQLLYLNYYLERQEPQLRDKIDDLTFKIETIYDKYMEQNLQKVKDDKIQLEGNEMTIDTILKHSKDTSKRKEAWENFRHVGFLIEQPLQELVDLRNKLAKALGFPNFYVYRLWVQQQEPNQVISYAEMLDKVTRTPFQKTKQVIAKTLAKTFEIDPDQLRPWHYYDVFFKETPLLSLIKIDEFYAKENVSKFVTDYFNRLAVGITNDLPVKIVAPLGRRPFFMNLDHELDARVYAHISQDAKTVETLLREMGKAARSVNHWGKYNYIRKGNSPCLDEIVATFFGRLYIRLVANDPRVRSGPELNSLQYLVGRVESSQLLVNSRWIQVMLRFEKEMYENPKQDLRKLWWDLVEKYQEIRKPEGRNAPDYASDITLVVSPVHYQNKLFAEICASQLHQHLWSRFYRKHGFHPISVTYLRRRGEVNRELVQKLFAYGDIQTWHEAVLYMTRENLNVKNFLLDGSLGD